MEDRVDEETAREVGKQGGQVTWETKGSLSRGYVPPPTPPANCSSSLQASRVEGQLIFLSKRDFRTWKSTQPFLTSHTWLKVGMTKVTTMSPMGTDPLQSIGVICHVKPTEAKPGISAMVTVPYIAM